MSLLSSRVLALCVLACQEMLQHPTCVRAEPVTVHILPALIDLNQVGRLHGQLAADQIHAYFQTREISKLHNFTRSEAGSVVLDGLRTRALEYTPYLEEEIAGIAEGAGVSVDDVWAVNMISELEAANSVYGSHCSDVIGRSPDGDVWSAHTEDWSMDFSPLCYFVVYNAAPGASFRPVGGLVYPGQVPGFAVAFTPTVWSTSNSLFPVGMDRTGLSVVSVARRALEAESAEEVADRYLVSGQALGMNTQVFSARKGVAFAADIESAGAANASCLTPIEGNATHFNAYKHLDVPASASASCAHRQAAADRHAPPKSRADVLAILGDTTDAELPVYRENNTMFAVLFHSEDGRFEVWHRNNPSMTEPDWVSTLSEVFQASAQPQVVALV